MLENGTGVNHDVSGYLLVKKGARPGHGGGGAGRSEGGGAFRAARVKH
jgi:hypothetical protein